MWGGILISTLNSCSILVVSEYVVLLEMLPRDPGGSCFIFMGNRKFTTLYWNLYMYISSDGMDGPHLDIHVMAGCILISIHLILVNIHNRLSDFSRLYPQFQDRNAYCKSLLL